MNEPRPARGRNARAAGTFALLAASACGGFFLYRLLNPPSALHALATPAPGASAPLVSEAPAGEVAPARAIPELLPAVVLPGLDGTPHRLSDWKGRPLLVNFWASWCEPCRREIPLLKELRRHSGGWLEVVGVAVDSREAAQTYAQQSGIDYPVLVGEQGGLEAVAAFGIEPVLPFSVFSDRDGRVVTLKVGELHRDEAQFILGRLRALDRHELDLPGARSQITAEIRRLSARYPAPREATAN